MIIDLPRTTTSAISKSLVQIRQEGGAIALGRVLTLVIVTTVGDEEEAIEAANDASREHPMRVIVLATEHPEAAEPAGKARSNEEVAARLDAQIRVGGDAGASEVILLRARGETADDPESLITGLLLPDAPVVAWWPGTAPNPVSESAIGRMATRRITDAEGDPDPHASLRTRGAGYAPGDTDFAWTRLTLWRAQLAAVLDQPPYETVRAAEVTGSHASPSAVLLAAWLAEQLRVPIRMNLLADPDVGIRSVELTRRSGPIRLERTAPPTATLTQPGHPTHHLALPKRNLRDCLAEELRRLDPDELYGTVVRKGLARLESNPHAESSKGGRG